MLASAMFPSIQVRRVEDVDVEPLPRQGAERAAQPNCHEHEVQAAHPTSV
jgi:hypothetical protein